MNPRTIVIVAGGTFGGVGMLMVDTINSPKAQQNVVKPAQINAEIRAQFRKRIKPMPVAAPKIATASMIANITSMLVLRNAGSSGICVEPTNAKLRRAREKQRIARTLPAIATTPAAITDAEGEEMEEDDMGGGYISLRDLAGKKSMVINLGT
jgi:hypothetical protein